MESTYILKCEYVGDLQVTRGVPASLLAHPHLFRICSSRLKQGSCPQEFFKRHTERFENLYTGASVSRNPLEWPDGRAYEVCIGPWRHVSPDALGLNDDDHSNFEESAVYQCSEMLSLSFYDGLHLERFKSPQGGTDWPAVFDIEGLNKEVLSLLDSAAWSIRPAGGSRAVDFYKSGANVSLKPQEDTKSACWDFGPGRGARIVWNPYELISGTLLHRWALCQPDTMQEFDTPEEALLQLTLTEGLTPAELIKQSKDATPNKPEEDAPASHFLSAAVVDCITLDLSGILPLRPNGESVWVREFESAVGSAAVAA